MSETNTAMNKYSTNMSNQNIAMNTLLTNIVNVNEDTATMKISDYYSNYNKYLNNGNYYYKNGKSKKALYNYFKALKYFKDVKLLFNISCIYTDMRKINESNIYLFKAINTCKMCNIYTKYFKNKFLNLCYYNLGANTVNVNKQRKYLLLGKYYFKKAKKYNPNSENTNRALKIVEETLYKKFKNK